MECCPIVDADLIVDALHRDKRPPQGMRLCYVCLPLKTEPAERDKGSVRTRPDSSAEKDTREKTLCQIIAMRCKQCPPVVHA
jgi:hypothetical protein